MSSRTFLRQNGSAEPKRLGKQLHEPDHKNKRDGQLGACSTQAQRMTTMHIIPHLRLPNLMEIDTQSQFMVTGAE